VSERRKQTRKSTNDYFIVFNRDTDELIGRVRDLTPDGVLIISDRAVAIGTTFSCKMHLPRMIGRRRYVYFDAESRWSRRNSRLGWHETGYQLSNVAHEDQKIIDELVSTWAVKEISKPTASPVTDT